MAVGSDAKAVVQSYVAVGKEGTFGTYASATTAVEALSLSFKVEIESEKIDSLSFNRGFAKRVQKDKTISGTLEQYVHPHESVLLFASSLGGTVSTTSLTSAATHSLTAGNFGNSLASVSFNVRKGDTHVWRYLGGRCNSMKLTANVNELVKASYEFVFKDATQLSDDISTSLSLSAILPFTYVNGSYRYAATEGSLTSTVVEPIQGFDLTINNNLISDANARALGSNIIDVLPATRREIEFMVRQRFDTTTTYNRFIQGTQGSVELVFTGQSISAEHNNGMTIRLPKVFQNSSDPELGGPGDILASEIPFDVIVDNPNTTTGRDIGISFTNSNQAGY